MSEEVKLPDDLAACEARLAALPLPSTSVNRDELMFRAGWAAGHAAASPLQVNGGVRKGFHWRSHLTTAAVAASLAAAATLSLSPRTENLGPGDSKAAGLLAEGSPRSVIADRSAEAPRFRALTNFDDLLDGRETLSLGASLAARPRLETNFVVTQAELDDAGPPARPATARRLLEDFAPREKASASPAGTVPAWPWSKLMGGNTI